MDRGVKSSPPHHNAHLDWIRFLAALAVVMNHARTDLFLEYGFLDPNSKNLATFIWALSSRLGYEAVMVFFVLSGFLVGGNAWERAAERRFSISAYAVDRAVRILIPLAAAIVLTVLVTAILGKQLHWPTIVGNFFSLQGSFVPVIYGNQPLWSLSYEVWFYVIAGALAVMLHFRRLIPVALLALLIAAFVLSQTVALYFAIWALGAIAYRYRPEKPYWEAFALGVLIAGSGALICQFSLPNTCYPEGHTVRWAAGAGTLSIGVALAIPQLYVAGPRMTKFGRSGTLLAGISYSLYLTHMPLLLLQPWHDSPTVGANGIARYCLVLLGLMIAAYLFSLAFEKPAPRIKKWIKSRVIIDE